MTPDETQLGPGNPLVERLRATPSIRVPHAMSLSTASDPATDAMIALGARPPTPLGADGTLAGVLVLGPKRSGMPYEDEEIAFLAHSARLPRSRSTRPGSSRPWKPSIKNCATRSTRSPSSSGES